MSLRSILRVGSTVSISGTDVSDVPMVLYQPFSIQTMVHLGSTFSCFGILRLGSALSVLDWTHIGSTLSLRGGCRLGSSLSVLDFVKMGSSLALRSFSRFGASMSIVGVARLGSRLSVFDNICMSPDKLVTFPEGGWSMGWNNAASKLEFLKTGVTKSPLTLNSAGGDLHGTWSVESIVSASDRRLKRDVHSLAATLPRKTFSSKSVDGQPASDALQALRPKRYQGLGARGFGLRGLKESPIEEEEPSIRFDPREVEEVLPDLVLPHPSAAQGADAADAEVRTGILYQDFLALLALAAQERQRRLEQHLVREREEVIRLQQQEIVIEGLERQVNALRGRFTRLRNRSPIPPRQES